MRRSIALGASLLWLAPGCRSDGPEAKVQAQATELDGCVTSDQAEIVTFESADGTELAGALFGEGEGAGVVLAHMNGSNVCPWVGLAGELSARGYTVLAFDFRGHGSSGGSAGGEHLVEDVGAAVSELEEGGAESVAGVGASMGGTAALVAAADGLLDAVVAISAPTDFDGADALTAVGDLESPSLFLAAKGDGPFDDHAQQLYRATATETKEIDLFHVGGHGTDMLTSEVGPDVVKLIVGFLEENLPVS